MTLKMKTWLHEHGLTATAIMRAAGIFNTHDLYRMLNGTKQVAPELLETLCGVYGMTDQELREVLPWTA